MQWKSHMKEFWSRDQFLDIKIMLILNSANNPVALVCFILKINLCENLQKQQMKLAPSQWQIYGGFKVFTETPFEK